MPFSSKQHRGSHSSMDSDGPSKEKGTQTVVKVFPFILDYSKNRASVTSDKKFCTVLSLEASQESKQFFSLLQYCPFHDIQENSLRILDLPRKTKLQWVNQNRFSEDALKKLTLADDDGVAEFCSDMLTRLYHVRRPTYVDGETQTDLVVRPYLLEEPAVATVYFSTGMQVTPAGCAYHSARHSM